LIARLKGILILKEPQQAILDVQGVGYELAIAASTYGALGEVGSEVTLLVQTHVREDALQLFGFSTEREKRLFQLLTGVSGIGPRLALAILSGMGAELLILALHRRDLARLVQIPNIGKKTAERLVVELADKAGALIAEERPEAGDASPPPNKDEAPLTADLVSALTNLGYPRALAERAAIAALREAPAAGFSAALRLALRSLAR
jgi:Holliday junction DNA helicase RuvA